MSVLTKAAVAGNRFRITEKSRSNCYRFNIHVQLLPVSIWIEALESSCGQVIHIEAFYANGPAHGSVRNSIQAQLLICYISQPH